MVCNFCGSMLDEDTVECPYCGHSTGVVKKGGPEGNSGNVFSKRKQQTGGNNAPNGKERMNLFHSPNKLLLVMNIGSAICLLISVICLFSIGSIRKEINTYNQEINNTIAGMEKKEQNIAERMNSIGLGSNSSFSANKADENTSKTINITKQPTDSTTYLGRGGSQDNKQDVPVFTVTATGSNMKFTWQRYEDGNQKWVDIALDENGCNEELGLRVINDLDNTYSELAAHDVKAIAYGTYRCKITDANGTKYTDSVVLTQRDNK